MVCVRRKNMMCHSCFKWLWCRWHSHLLAIINRAFSLILLAIPSHFHFHYYCNRAELEMDYLRCRATVSLRQPKWAVVTTCTTANRWRTLYFETQLKQDAREDKSLRVQLWTSAVWNLVSLLCQCLYFQIFSLLYGFNMFALSCRSYVELCSSTGSFTAPL